MKKTALLLLLFPLLAFSAPQYTWESQGTSYTGQIDLGSSSTDPLSGSLTPSYGAINAQNAVQPPVVVVSSASSGGTTASSGMCFPADHRAVYTSDGSFTVPSGITKVYISGIGGGGAGAFTGTNYAGGGGSGYPLLKYPVTVSPGASIPITIGMGGIAPTSYPNAGGNGGTTSFGAYAIMYGGGGAGAADCSFGIGGANGGSGSSCYNSSGQGGYGGSSSVGSGYIYATGGGAVLGGTGSLGNSYGTSGSTLLIPNTPGIALPGIGDSVFPGNGGKFYAGMFGGGGAGGIHVAGYPSPFTGSVGAGGSHGDGFGSGGGGQWHRKSSYQRASWHPCGRMVQSMMSAV